METATAPARAPEFSFPGISWTTTTTSGKIDFDPDGTGPAVASSWAVGNGRTLEGVQCERCHNYALHSNTAIVPRGVISTALCLQCHRQEHILAGNGTLGANIKPTPYSDNNPFLPSSDPVYPLPSIEVGSDSGYAPQFFGYSTGNEFLNSVHSKFTGTFGQINLASKYTSGFSYESCNLDGFLYAPDQTNCESAGGVWSDVKGCQFNQANCEANLDPFGNPGVWSVAQGGCTTCHDVHVSIVPAVNASAPFTKKCPDCHVNSSVNAPQVIVAAMTHPTGTGTPFGNPQNINAGCVKCHMPKPNDSAGYSSHIWRINTGATYTTFPTAAEWNAGQKTAYSSPSGTYTNAVWLDAGLACGPCHSVSKDNPTNRPAKHYFEKAALAIKAAGMHSGSQWSTVCEDCHTNGGDPAAWQAVPGVNHHSTGCTTCHSNPGVVQFNLTIETCLSCHGPANAPLVTPNIQSVTQGTDHHSGDCMNCHTQPGTGQYTTATSSCRSCHTDKNIGVSSMNHPSSPGTPATCVTCHKEPGVPISSIGIQAVCGQCHGGSAGAGATKNGAPYISEATLAYYAKGMHNKSITIASAPTATFTTVTVLGTDTTLTATATFDAKAYTKKVTMNWGDGTFEDLAVGPTATTFTTTISHHYLSTRVRSYPITLAASDGVHPVVKASAKVAVPQKLSAGGTTLANARVTLKIDGHVRKVVLSNSSGAFSLGTNIPYGRHVVIHVYKYGVASPADYDNASFTTSNDAINIL